MGGVTTGGFAQGTPTAITLADLPTPLRERYIGTSGKWLLQVFCKDSLWDFEPLEHFANQIRAEHALPPRYFLYVGRMVEEKGPFDLLAAYARLDENTRSQIGLVFVGDGPGRTDLAQRASSLFSGVVKFCGWVDRERISEFYALAEALIFPTHSDPWGLVVNEAMACGLPIVSSDAAGCAPDLVHQGKNGFRFRPRDIDGLAHAMRTICDQPDLAARMGTTSFDMIQSYTPEICAAGLMEAVNFACGGVT